MTRAQPAADERERGLRRIRAVTVAGVVAASGLGAVTAAAAGMTLPGRSTGTTGASGASGQDAGAQQSQQGQSQDGGLQVPAQPPQAPSSDQGPLVISGSS